MESLCVHGSPEHGSDNWLHVNTPVGELRLALVV